MDRLVPKAILLSWAGAVLFSVSGGVSDTSDPYCFSFTWLGPSWGNDSRGNGTCAKLPGSPEVCMDPLVITYDSTPPNMTYLWKKYDKTEIGCRLSEIDACVKFSYYYNGLVENITYMCARVTVDDESSMTSGCETASIGGYVKEVCACRTYAGADFPCNGAATLAPAGGVAALAISVVIYLNFPHT